MKNFVLPTLCLLVSAITTGCTYNISMAHTSGYAEDVIDDTASNTPNVSPNINVPVTPSLPITPR